MARVVAQHGDLRREPGPGEVRDLLRYRREPRGAERTAHVGMAVFLGSWAMLFVALFFAYAFVRGNAPAWPPLDAPRLPRVLPGLNTLVVAASSVAVARALRAQELARGRIAAASLAVAATLGAIFLAMQTVVWIGLWRRGLVPSGGPYPSVFYAFTAFHALHVLVGLAALAWLAVRARSGAASRTDIRLWGWYWHFVSALWAALYVTVYLT